MSVLGSKAPVITKSTFVFSFFFFFFKGTFRRLWDAVFLAFQYLPFPQLPEAVQWRRGRDAGLLCVLCWQPVCNLMSQISLGGLGVGAPAPGTVSAPAGFLASSSPRRPTSHHQSDRSHRQKTSTNRKRLRPWTWYQASVSLSFTWMRWIK